VFDPADMGQKRRTKVASEGNDLLAMIADIDAAMRSLDPRSYGVVYLRIVDEMKLAEIAKEWEVSPQRVDQIFHRAIRKVIEYLGGNSPY
jgi:RNA polymerase sigma factor (sigma-70 family)